MIRDYLIGETNISRDEPSAPIDLLGWSIFKKCRSLELYVSSIFSTYQRSPPGVWKNNSFASYFTVVFGIGSISIGGWTMNFSDDVTSLTEIENRLARMKNPERIESQKNGRRKKGWSRIDLYEREGNATFVASTVSRNGPCIITKRITKGKKIITRLLVQTN